MPRQFLLARNNAKCVDCGNCEGNVRGIMAATSGARVQIISEASLIRCDAEITKLFGKCFLDCFELEEVEK